TCENIDNSTNAGKDRRLLAAVFFVEAPRLLTNDAAKHVFVDLRFGDVRIIADKLPENRQEQSTTFIEGREAEFASAGFETNWRIDEANVPLGVPSGIFIARCE